MLLTHKRLRAEDLAHWQRLERADAVHAWTQAHLRRVDQACAAIASFAAADHCYAGVSWGKDSTVLAHLVLAAAPKVPLVWVRVEPIRNPDCLLVRDAFLKRYTWAVYREVEVWCTRDAAGEWHAKGTLERGFGVAARDYGKRYVSGVRGEESGARKKRAMRGHVLGTTCAPLAFWGQEDVFAYLYAHRLPVHPAYACTLGGLLERGRVRVSSLGGQRGTGMGRTSWEQAYYRQELAEIRHASPPRGTS